MTNVGPVVTNDGRAGTKMRHIGNKMGPGRTIWVLERNNMGPLGTNVGLLGVNMGHLGINMGSVGITMGHIDDHYGASRDQYGPCR